jgi:CO/xanthine dehydrogenase Mo-binding subunit
VAWEQQKLSTPHNARGVPTTAQLVDPAYLAGSAWGIGDNPYAIPALEGSYTVIEHPVPIGPWRAVFAPSSVFAREAFLDEIAAETGADPLALRLRLLGADDPSVATEVTVSGTQVDRRRLRRTLERAAEMSEWSRPPAPGRARGIACDVFHNRTMTAYVVEVERTPTPGSTLPFRIVKAWGAIDCGVAVHPDGVIQQVESGIIWSLSNLKTEITFQRGGARETNFDGFEIARLADTPEIEVEIVPNDDDAPRGVGEPPVSAFAPAVVNALSRLVGRRLRSLPVRSADLA